MEVVVGWRDWDLAPDLWGRKVIGIVENETICLEKKENAWPWKVDILGREGECTIVL